MHTAPSFRPPSMQSLKINVLSGHSETIFENISHTALAKTSGENLLVLGYLLHIPHTDKVPGNRLVRDLVFRGKLFHRLLAFDIVCYDLGFVATQTTVKRRPHSLHLYLWIRPLRPLWTTFEEPQKMHFLKHISNNRCKDLNIKPLQRFHHPRCPLCQKESD